MKHKHIEDNMTDETLLSIDPQEFSCHCCAAAVFFNQLIHKRKLSADRAIDAAVAALANCILSVPENERKLALIHALSSLAEKTNGELVNTNAPISTAKH